MEALRVGVRAHDERDNYGKVPKSAITPPDLKLAYYTSDKKDEIVLEFDQPMAWSNFVSNHVYLDGAKGNVASGVASEKMVRLKLKTPVTAGYITYLDSRSCGARISFFTEKTALPHSRFVKFPFFPETLTEKGNDSDQSIALCPFNSLDAINVVASALSARHLRPICFRTPIRCAIEGHAAQRCRHLQATRSEQVFILLNDGPMHFQSFLSRLPTLGQV